MPWLVLAQQKVGAGLLTSFTYLVEQKVIGLSTHIHTNINVDLYVCEQAYT